MQDINHTAELKRNLKALRKRKIQVGILGDSEIAMYAGANEFGVTNKIPERSFLRTSFDDKKTVNRIVKEAQKAFDIRENPKMIMDRIGLLMTAAIQKKIRSNIPPPNAPSTRKRKRGKDKTLIDTGRMLRAVTHEII